MIKVFKEEYTDGNKAICNLNVYLFGVLVYTNVFKTTNREIIDSLNYAEKITIKGFNNEN